jgi:hypothetical protein
MTDYLSLPASEKSDYWRMYVPEALAATVYLNMHLADTIGDPTADATGADAALQTDGGVLQDAGSCRSLPQHYETCRGG